MTLSLEYNVLIKSRIDMTNKKFINSLLLTIVITFFSGCSYKSAGFVNYDKQVYSGSEAGNKTFKEIGPVMIVERDFIWADCNELSHKALNNIKALSIKNGGDSIINLKWIVGSSHMQTNAAICEQQFGWILLWPVLLTPVTQNVMLEGTIIKFDDDQNK